MKTQLIAHDKEVFDIAFSRAGGNRDIFASVGKPSLKKNIHVFIFTTITSHFTALSYE